MKKIFAIPILFFGLFFFCLDINAQGYSLDDAVTASKSAIKEPKHLPVAEGDPEVALVNTIQGATNYITGLVAAVAILFVVINSAKLVFALGEAEDITTAKKGLMWSLGGLVLIMFAFVLVKTVISIAFSGEV